MSDEDFDEVARWFVEHETAHLQRHRENGLDESQAVYEQQTGHRVCGWCGYCEGGCNSFTSSTDLNFTFAGDQG